MGKLPYLHLMPNYFYVFYLRIIGCPDKKIQYLLETNSETEIVDKEKKKTSAKSPDTIAWWQEPGDTPVRWEHQTLDPILLALNSKAICSGKNRRVR